MKRLFLLEDDLSLISGLSFAVKKQGYEIDAARTILEADTLWANGSYDLAILDVSLPDGSGFDFCRKIRRMSKVPVMFLTAADEETDIIMGLDMGGDDYITKPYNPALLLLKIEALFRRLKPQEKQEELEYRGVFLNPLKSTLRYQDREIVLSKNEISIFHYLLKNRGKIVSRDELMDYLWDCNDFVDDNTLTVNVNRLRKKLEEIQLVGVIETRRRQGYILI